MYPLALHLVNTIVLHVKQYVYRTRCLSNSVSIQQVIGEIYKTHGYEKYYSRVKNKVAKRNRKWSLLFNDMTDIMQNEIYTKDYRGD